VPMLPTSSVSIGRRRYSGGDAGLAMCITRVGCSPPPRLRHQGLEARLAHVVVDEPESLLAEQVLDVLLAAGAAVVDAQHVVAAIDEEVAQVRPEEAGPAGDDGALLVHERPTPS
jgi:hypothetical protein